MLYKFLVVDAVVEVITLDRQSRVWHGHGRLEDSVERNIDSSLAVTVLGIRTSSDTGSHNDGL